MVDPDIAVITTIAHDHADFLGDDLDGIGFEKAGILRQERPAVLGSRELPASVSARLEALAAPAYWLGQAFAPEAHDGGWRWQGSDAQGARYELDSLPDPGLPLDNAAVALQVLTLLGITPQGDAVREALATVSLPGRLQWLGNWCLDVAHNPHAAAYVAERLAARPQPARRIGLLGVLGDKDAEALIAALGSAVDAWVAVGLDGPRGRSAAKLGEAIESVGAPLLACCDSPVAGVAWLRERLGADEEVLVCGSFLTVAEALGALTAAAD